MNTQIRVLVVDDHPMLRKGVRGYLERDPMMNVVGDVGNGVDALDAIEKQKPDVVLMDLVMPGVDGFELIRNMRQRYPEVRVLVFTGHEDDEKVIQAIQAGANGYLLKDASPEDLLSAVERAFKGEPVLEPRIAKKALDAIAHPQERAGAEAQITERERDVLRLLACGLTNKQIADRLGIGEATVRTHMSKLFSKLDLSSRTQAALFAVRKGLVEPSGRTSAT
jgi:two-component system, NarL family, response regulator LiaR